MVSNPDCKKPEHKMHMCSMKESDFDKVNPDKVSEMAENPKFKCGKCGAKVKSSVNVCSPVEL